MLLWVMGVEFENICTVSGKWNLSRVIPRLYRWACKTLRLSPLVVKHSVDIMSARLNPMKFVYRISGGIKFWDPVEGSNTGGMSPVKVGLSPSKGLLFVSLKALKKLWKVLFILSQNLFLFSSYLSYLSSHIAQYLMK